MDDSRTRSEFDELFGREFNRCTRVARAITGDAEVARDVAAEAFARAWARWPTLKDQRPGAWVVRVSINLAIDAIRKKVPQFAVPAYLPSVEEFAIARWTLEDALVHLPAQQRAAIVLRYIADYSETDVAIALGVSPGTVKSQLNRGRKRLRDALAADDRLDRV